MRAVLAVLAVWVPRVAAVVAAIRPREGSGLLAKDSAVAGLEQAPAPTTMAAVAVVAPEVLAAMAAVTQVFSALREVVMAAQVSYAPFPVEM